MSDLNQRAEYAAVCEELAQNKYNRPFESLLDDEQAEVRWLADEVSS